MADGLHRFAPPPVGDVPAPELADGDPSLGVLADGRQVERCEQPRPAAGGGDLEDSGLDLVISKIEVVTPPRAPAPNMRN